MSELLLAAHPCAECLLSRARIVSGDRAAEIVRQCRRDDVHFQCHKGSLAGLNVHCRAAHDLTGGDRAYRFARAVGIPVREIDPDKLKMEEST